jgi:type IV pilus biogenesis protein CpaD/CtpE
MTYRDTIYTAAVTMVAASLLLACAPTVKVQAPDKPIEINMNVKIEHEIRVKVEKDIDNLLSENKDLF